LERRTPEAIAKGRRAKKTSAFSTTLYPDAATEVTTQGGVTSWTRYPHMDLKVVGTNKFFLHRDHLASVRAVTDGEADKQSIQ
jgi:hypothetical protein